LEAQQLLSIPPDGLVARIKTLQKPYSTVVIVVGRLRAGDMRRLEHACGSALENAQPDLVLDIQRVTEIDGVAAAYLERMATRGAVIRRI
jgi:anti-anti-sigma regulatory factor